MDTQKILNSNQINDSERDKVIRLIDYLLKLANLRTKVIRDINEYEHVLWLADIPHEQGCFTQAWESDDEHESDEWLEVQNTRECQSYNKFPI